MDKMWETVGEKNRSASLNWPSTFRENQDSCLWEKKIMQMTQFENKKVLNTLDWIRLGHKKMKNNWSRQLVESHNHLLIFLFISLILTGQENAQLSMSIGSQGVTSHGHDMKIFCRKQTWSSQACCVRHLCLKCAVRLHLRILLLLLPLNYRVLKVINVYSAMVWSEYHY